MKLACMENGVCDPFESRNASKQNMKCLTFNGVMLYVWCYSQLRRVSGNFVLFVLASVIFMVYVIYGIYY